MTETLINEHAFRFRTQRYPDGVSDGGRATQQGFTRIGAKKQ